MHNLIGSARRDRKRAVSAALGVLCFRQSRRREEGIASAAQRESLVQGTGRQYSRGTGHRAGNRSTREMPRRRRSRQPHTRPDSRASPAQIAKRRSTCGHVRLDDGLAVSTVLLAMPWTSVGRAARPKRRRGLCMGQRADATGRRPRHETVDSSGAGTYSQVGLALGSVTRGPWDAVVPGHS